MATKKKVASKTSKKAVPASKTVAKKAAPAAKKPAAKPVPAKKAAAPKKAAAGKAAPKKATPAPKKAAVKKAPVKAAPKKVAAKKPVVAPKKAAVAKASAKKAAPAPKAPTTKTTPVKAKAPVAKKAPVTKAPAAKPAPAASKPAAPKATAKPVISKPVEKVDIMPAKNKQEKPAKEPVKKASRLEDPIKRVSERPTTRTASKPSSASRPTMKTVTYAPEFTKSVLDQPDAPSGPIYRYSDPELQEFKEIILKKLEAAKKELVYLQGLITRKDEAGTDDTENKYMSMEDGSGSQEREQLNQMASRQIQFIDHLEKALMRIENKTYGICRVTGKLIDKARLKAVPHATLSIEAKLAKSK